MSKYFPGSIVIFVLIVIPFLISFGLGEGINMSFGKVFADIAYFLLLFLYMFASTLIGDFYKKSNLKTSNGIYNLIVWLYFVFQLYHLPRWLMEKGF